MNKIEEETIGEQNKRELGELFKHFGITYRKNFKRSAREQRLSVAEFMGE